MAYVSGDFPAAEPALAHSADTIRESMGLPSQMTQQEKYDAAVLETAIKSSWGRDYGLLLQFAKDHAAQRSGLNVERLDKHLVRRARVFRAVDQEFVQLTGLAVGSEDAATELPESRPFGQTGGGLWSDLTKESLKWCSAKLRWVCDEQEPTTSLALEELVALKCALFAEAQGSALRQAQRSHQGSALKTFSSTSVPHSSSSGPTLRSQLVTTCLAPDLFFDVNIETLLRAIFREEEGDISVMRYLCSLIPNSKFTVTATSDTLSEPTVSSESILTPATPSRLRQLSLCRQNISSDLRKPSTAAGARDPSRSTNVTPSVFEEAWNGKAMSKHMEADRPRENISSGPLADTEGAWDNRSPAERTGEIPLSSYYPVEQGDRRKGVYDTGTTDTPAQDKSAFERTPGTTGVLRKDSWGDDTEWRGTPPATLSLLFQMAEQHIIQRLTRRYPELLEDIQTSTRGGHLSTRLSIHKSRQEKSFSRSTSPLNAQPDTMETASEASEKNRSSGRLGMPPATSTVNAQAVVEFRTSTVASSQSICQQGLKRKDTISDRRNLPSVARQSSAYLGTHSLFRGGETLTASVQGSTSRTTGYHHGKRRKFHFTKSEDYLNFASPKVIAVRAPKLEGPRTERRTGVSPFVTTPLGCTPGTSQAESPLFQLIDDRTGAAVCRVLQCVVMRDLIVSCSCPGEDEACLQSVATSLDILVEIVISISSLMCHLRARSSSRRLSSEHPSRETEDTSERDKRVRDTTTHQSSSFGDDREFCFEKDRKRTAFPRLNITDPFLSDVFERTLIDLVALPFCYGFCVLSLSPWHRKLQQTAATGFYQLVRSLDRLLCLNREALDIACRLFLTQTSEEQSTTGEKEGPAYHREGHKKTKGGVRVQDKGRGTLFLAIRRTGERGDLARTYCADTGFALYVCIIA
ncbi:hypothetical protein TGDOM2_462982 [Toxoplasma gondii GAB2-2007-GAL-DOM2]|uniref:UBA/TS-N domain-containing protein n=1 Tax=Toxoplasma gondii GAB2-2007-GAL-DOM2 TaxID=1130820 RepID=A0A086KH05_TOXGO|nr:hypothetical protein TGDOM2_462982 [Toxoplasma gondii GAB2-2007-GAL-DOM2]